MDNQVITQTVKEYEAINLSKLATTLGTDEDNLRHQIEEMKRSGSNVRVRDDIVYVSRKYEGLLITVVLLMFVLIVLLPAYMGWN